ncbi:hypothetical protein BDF21DRAFT_373586 [Thamnidium elegans]|nr:hypothetical protein BDF21DRAFT_373586 [Thamnidium elegans]
MESGLKHTPLNLNDPHLSSSNTMNGLQEDTSTPTDVKLVEARIAILLRNPNPYATRNEPTMWILEHMFRPLTTRDYDEYQLLLLSASMKSPWERKRKDVPLRNPQENHFTVSPGTTAEGTPTPPVISSQYIQQSPNQTVVDKMYIITPRTRILTVAKEHSMVFMIDLSSSLATIETSTGNVMIGSAYNVLENIINGLVRPFSLNVSDTSPPIVMEHIIRITVIAECSQFGSNMNVIPILAEYPTMRVLIQNVLVSVNNVSAVLKNLKDSINTFKKDLGKFRKKLTMKRSKGYALDVRGDHAQTVTESAESNFSASLESPTKSNTQLRKNSVISIKGNDHLQPSKHTRNKSITKQIKKSDSNSAKKTSHHHHHHRHSSASVVGSSNAAGPMKRSTAKDKKDVWGVGKTGSTLSYILRAGLFALNLLPKDGQPSLILMTDGVVKSNIQDESVIRQLTSEHVSCNVVQIGQEKGFFPTLNFGFVPDNEILEYLTTATNGNFMFAENCPPIASSTTDDGNEFFSEPPNVYHHRLLLKEIYLDKVHSSRQSRKNKDSNNSPGQNKSGEISKESSTSNVVDMASSSVRPHREHRLFPWDPLSQPIVEDIGMCKFKEYFLPTECWHFMRARLRQGFLLHSVTLIDETKPVMGVRASTQGRYAGQILDEDNINNTYQKKESVVIVFVLHWQPSITVEYRIKSLWTSSLRHYLRTLSLNQERLINIPEEPRLLDSDNIFTCMRAPRAQIFIKSTASFTHMLSNWDQSQRRNQMMAVQGAKANVDLNGSPGSIKVGKMKRLLERLSETDGMLKQLVQFNLSEKINTSTTTTTTTTTTTNFNTNETISKGGIHQIKASTSSGDWSAQLNYIQKFSSHWAKLDRSELRVFNMCWYDEQYFNLIIGSSMTPYNIKDYRLDGTHTMGAEFDEIQVALNLIYSKLENWSTFMSEDQQVYIKILNINETLYSSKSHPMDKKSLDLPMNSGRKQIVPQFCELRVVRETDKVLCIKLMFFNIDLRHRHCITQELQDLLNTEAQQHGLHQTLASLEIKNPIVNGLGIEEEIESNTTVTLAKRPLSSLLMRDGIHFLPTSGELEYGKLSATHGNHGPSHPNKSLWFINPALLLTGEFIVRNYLLQYTWHWDAREITNEKYLTNRYMVPILSLAFEHISVTRLEQKWNLISFSKSFAHFYKEIYCSDSNSVYSVQYFIWKDFPSKRISTELWLEPHSDEITLKFHDSIKIATFEKDRQVLSQLTTFDIMSGFGQSHSGFVNDALSDPMEVEDEARGTVKVMQRASLFNLSSVLRLGSFLFALYRCPNYNRHFHPEGNDSSVVDHQQQQAAAAATAAVAHSMSTSINLSEPQDSGSYIRRRNGNTSSGIGSSATSSSRSRNVSKFSPAASPLVTRTPLIWHSDHKSSTTCTCPRPDELICAEKDDISKLRPVFRDIALLHYYVENLLSAVTDRSMSLNKTPVDEFWSSIVKQLLQTKDVGASRSTLYVAQNFRHLRCFVKSFDPSVFVVILIPRLDAVVKGLCSMDASSTMPSKESFDRMGLMMFECHRQDSGNNYNTVLNFDQIKVRPIDPTSSKDWLESLGSTLRPDLSRGYFSSTVMNEPLSDRTLRLMQDVSQVYSRSFVKSIFTCLLHGRAIDSEDFEKVLEICDESNLDIDLTGYLNVQTLLKRRSRTSEEELVSANQRFISVLGHYFEPVIISNTKWTNMYCYRPPFAKVGQKLGLSLSSGEKPSNLADVVVCAQNPLFVRLDCTLRKPADNGVGFTEITFPLRTLPVLYEGESEDGNMYNFEPESIGTKFSPVDSADGTTATLHLVCMTLPQSEYDPPNALFSHKATCPAEDATPPQASFLDADKTHRARLPSLSQDKQDALVETEARLTWLFTEEIMHGLLRSGPITQNVIRYIEAQLKKKNPFVDFPTTMFIPLAFVKNQKESRRMFFEELEKHDKSLYRLVRVGDCFYASDNGSNSNMVSKQDLLEEDDDESLFDGEGLNITTDISRKKAASTAAADGEQGSDEFCEGLGISILEPETPDEEDMDMNTKDEPMRTQLYWLLLIPQVQNVQIYFYSKMQQSVNRSEIIRITKSMVNEVMERTNKMSLLQYLHDTRRCSKYLLAPTEDEKTMSSSGDESSDEDDNFIPGSRNNLVEILSTSGEEATFAPPKKFIPGQFGCEIVFTKHFPLHWRLSPNSAFNKLMTDTLPPFLVKNKPGMFVISHENAVVYCFLSEVNIALHSSTLSDTMNQSFLSINNNDTDDSYYMSHPESPYGSSFVNGNDNNDGLGTSQSRIRHAAHMYNKHSPQGSITSQQISPRHSPSFTDAGVSNSSPATGKRHTGRQYEGRELVLEVYGVESDSYIVDGLVEMIDSRITSEITLKEVQQFLNRNPNSKLSRADIEFILPVEKSPLIQKQLCIPSLVENTVQFLKIFRKNILSGSALHAIHSNYLQSVVKRQHDLRYSSYGNSDFNGRLLGENANKLLSEEWSCLDLSFYYNYLNRAPGMYLPFEQKIGEGVAGICLSVVNEDDLAYNKIVSNYPSGGPIKEANKFDLQDLTACLDSDFEKSNNDEKLRICIDIWSHCKIDVNQIYLYFYKSFRQSICDYIIENAVSFIPRQIISETNSNYQEEFKSVATLLMFTLQKASEWESSTVKKISRLIQLTPWYFDGIVQQLKCDLIDIHNSLEPTVARTVLSSALPGFSSDPEPEDYKLYTPGFPDEDHFAEENDDKSEQKKPYKIPPTSNQGKRQKKVEEVTPFSHENYRYLVISGLPELYNKYVLSNPRRSSTEVLENGSRMSSRIMFGNGVNSIVEEEPSNYLKGDGFKRDDTNSLHSRQESLASSISKILPTYLSKQKNSDYKEVSHQHSFLVFTLDSSQLSIYAYNCSDTFTEHVFNSTYKNVVSQETRHLGLNNILHQKLGLFHHTDTMSRILSHNNDIAYASVSSVSAAMPATPLQHSALAQVQNNNNPRVSPNVVSTIGRLVQIDSCSSIPTIDSFGSDRRHPKSKSPVDLEILRNLVTNTFDYNHRFKGASSHLNLTRMMSTDSSFQQQNVFETVDNAKLCRVYKSNAETVYTAVRGADANTVLRDVYAESTEENKNRYDKDYLLRHGEPYLDMYLARSKPLAAHEKAFKVYTKWADQYYGPGHTETTDEMMTVDELKQILKASRLLHFCRTPLIFSETNTSVSDTTSVAVNGVFEKLFNKPTVQKSEEMTAWYERLSRGFMKEYASYLGSIGMHLIVYGPSNDQQDEVEAYLSHFTITENYSVVSPVVYLLQVFEGGSIMCEVRLTGAFVSVTLYTLHRRYGRLQSSPYTQRRKEIGRENFQSFMGECDQFKQRIHVNSFVFDFHLRYIQRSLDDVELLPSNLNLLSIIKNTVAVYDRPAIYSRNRIINGIYEFPVEESLSNLSSWILGSGTKLKLKTLKVDKVPVACFISSDDLSFENKESDTNSPFRYTLVICPAEKQLFGKWRDSISVHRQGSFDMMGSNPTQKLVTRIINTGSNDEYTRKISLQYFILVTYRGMDRCTSFDHCQRAWSEVLKEKPQRYANFLDEVLVPETFKMNDVFESAKLKIDSIIDKAIHYFHLESDWNKLYEIVRPNLTKELPGDLVHLTSKFNPIDLGVADPSFNKFLQLKGLNWNDALDNLKTFYKMTSGEIYIRDTRHVLLFIPNAVSPTFFHFVCTPGEKCIVTINTKEDQRKGYGLREDEKVYISQLATNLSYYIWKRVHYY